MSSWMATPSGTHLPTTAGTNAFTVRVTDSGGLTYDETFSINLTNVNETPTDISLSNAGVAENQPLGTTIGTLSTTDPDAGNTFTYALVGGTGSDDNASFTPRRHSMTRCGAGAASAYSSALIADRSPARLERALSITSGTAPDVSVDPESDDASSRAKPTRAVSKRR